MVLNHATTGIECFATVIYMIDALQLATVICTCMIDALQLVMHIINMIMIHLEVLNVLWHPYRLQ